MTLVGCHHKFTLKCLPGEQPLLNDLLYFGLSIPNGGVVSHQQWDNFLHDIVTPKFPDGFTVLDAKGQWLSSTGDITKENSRVLSIIYTDNKTNRSAINHIKKQYVITFNQESVLNTRQMVCATF